MPAGSPGGDAPAVTAKDAQRRAAARRFAIEAARLAAHTRCHDVIVLDVSGLSPVTDFFVIASGTSPRQMKSVADELEEWAAPQNWRPLSRSGADGAHWILVDFFDVVVHVFSNEARLFYDIENLWGDAQRVDWRDGSPPPPSSQGT